MTPPPLPDGCTGYPVDPHIHTSVDDDPEREGWTTMIPKIDNSGELGYEITRNEYLSFVADRAALNVAVTGIHELQTKWARSAVNCASNGDDAIAYAIREAARQVSALLERIEAAK